MAQSIRAAGKESTPLEALHANAAHAQGMLSASAAILELAGGGGTFDAEGNLEITEDHVQAGINFTCALISSRPIKPRGQ